MSYQKVKPCNQGCGAMIYWHADTSAANGKGYFIDEETHEKHVCPNWNKGNKTAFTGNTMSNPAQMAGSELKAAQFTKAEEAAIEMNKTFLIVAGQLTKMLDALTQISLYTRKISTQLDNMSNDEQFLTKDSITKARQQKRNAAFAAIHEDDKEDDLYNEIADVDDATGMPDDR